MPRLRRQSPPLLDSSPPSKPASSAATAAARRSAQRTPMGTRRRSVFTAGSIARRELRSPGAVAKAAFSWKAVSDPRRSTSSQMMSAPLAKRRGPLDSAPDRRSLNAWGDAIVASPKPISQCRSRKFYGGGIGGRASLPIPQYGRGHPQGKRLNRKR